MKLRSLIIAGFRGFNSERAFSFNDHLTVLSAPNSHGKTSITEALEFLLYGETSKVARAASKEEFRNSYRNRHYSSGVAAYVEAELSGLGGTPLTLRIELDADGECRRFVNGSLVAEWPFSRQLNGAARPFVVQHALKDLLLASPAERFQGFAKLLGLTDVEAFQQAIYNLSTKPEVNLSDASKRGLSELRSIESRVQKFPELKDISRGLGKNTAEASQLYKNFHARAESILGIKIEAEQLLSTMMTAREDAAAKIFAGTIDIGALSPNDQARRTPLRELIPNCIDTNFIATFAKLTARDITERLRKEAALLDLGSELIADKPENCPLCGQPLDERRREHIKTHNGEVRQHLSAAPDLRSDISRKILELSRLIADHSHILHARTGDLRKAMNPAHQGKMKALYGSENEASWEIVLSAGASIATAAEEVEKAQHDLEQSISTCKTALAARSEGLLTCSPEVPPV